MDTSACIEGTAGGIGRRGARPPCQSGLGRLLHAFPGPFLDQPTPDTRGTRFLITTHWRRFRDQVARGCPRTSWSAAGPHGIAGMV